MRVVPCLTWMGEQLTALLLAPSWCYLEIYVEVRHRQTSLSSLAVLGPFRGLSALSYVPGYRARGRHSNPIHDIDDYRRLTPAGVAQLFPGRPIEKVTILSSIGSTMALLLNTLDGQRNYVLPYQGVWRTDLFSRSV